MKARNFDDVRKDLPVKDRINIAKSARSSENPKDTPDEKLAKAIDSLGIVLKQAMEKPDTEAKAHYATLSAVLDALKDIKAIIPKPEKANQWEFDVKRDGKGFISKVNAKAV